MRATVSTFARCALAAAALAAAFYAAVFARAGFLFDQDTAASIPAAAHLVPYNARYVARLAAWQPEKKIALLHEAVELNPYDVESWIQLGLAAEIQHHNVHLAEHYYLQAARVDRMFLPKWTLTNFYFRQQQEAEFYHWAKATLEITPYPADPVFTQMWLMSQNAETNAAAVPQRPAVLLEYAGFLTNAHQFAAVAPVVERLTALVDSRHAAQYGRDDQIEPIEDRLLAAGELGPALQVWSDLHARGWIHLPVPTPASPLTNGDFSRAFLRHGFDWTPAACNGVAIDQAPQDKSVRVTFSGDQPEHCTILQHYIPLDPDSGYRLGWNASAQPSNALASVAWHLHPIEAGTRPSAGMPELISPDLSIPPAGLWIFKPIPGASLYLLALEYSRPLGSVPVTGTIALSAVSLQKQ